MHGIVALATILAVAQGRVVPRDDATAEATPDACAEAIEALCPVARAPGFLWSMSCVDDAWSCSYLPALEVAGQGRSRPVRIMTDAPCSAQTDNRCAASARFAQEEEHAQGHHNTTATVPANECERLAQQFEEFWWDAEVGGQEMDDDLQKFWRDAEIKGQEIAEKLHAATTDDEIAEWEKKSNDHWDAIEIEGDVLAAKMEKYWQDKEDEGVIKEKELEDCHQRMEDEWDSASR